MTASPDGPAEPPPGRPEGLSFWHPASLIATWFGTGHLPKAPGTWGSLAALPLAWVIAERAGPYALMAAGIAMFCAGIWACGIYLRHSREADPGVIVIDEVAGQMLAVVPAGLDPLAFTLGFVLFRIFDIMKPWPLGALERALPGAAGVMADDVAAGLYTAFMLSLYLYILERHNVLF